MIAFKQPSSILEWRNLHPRLLDVLLWLDGRWPLAVMVVTRIFDPPVVGETGMHRTNPHRAADIRTHALTEASLKDTVNKINAAWDYGDGSHKVALAHKVDGGAMHLHLQVRDETHFVA